ncbi:MAG: hypothetical protein AB7M05_07685 [Alphaproteobacteria bacterium]
MPSGQAFLDQLSRAIWFDNTRGRPFVVNLPLLRQLIAAEQKALAGTGQKTRTDTGQMKPVPFGGAGPTPTVPAIVMIGADGPATGGDGEDVFLDQKNTNGHILIAAGGNATRAVSVPTRGGDGACLGGSEGLTVGLGGHGAITLNPPTMPYGANGTDGGRGGHGAAGVKGQGCVIVGEGGNGGRGSPGQVALPASPGWPPGGIGGFFLIQPRPPGTPGTDGDDGDGGVGWAIGEDHADYTAVGGRAWRPPVPTWNLPGIPPAPLTLWGPVTNPGAYGQHGRALVIHGTVDVTIDCRNGDGTAGTEMTR